MSGLWGRGKRSLCTIPDDATFDEGMSLGDAFGSDVRLPMTVDAGGFRRACKNGRKSQLNGWGIAFGRLSDLAGSSPCRIRIRSADSPRYTARIPRSRTLP